MSIELPLNTMTVAEKIQLLETVWDNLCHESGDVSRRIGIVRSLRLEHDDLRPAMQQFRPGLKQRLDCLRSDNESRYFIRCGKRLARRLLVLRAPIERFRRLFSELLDL